MSLTTLPPESPEPHDPAQPSALPPDDSAQVRRSDLAQTAGGLGAIAATLRTVRTQPGLWRGGLALLKVNQPDGFDCPGCAWPEPERTDRGLEFCENGAKAVAGEATRKTVRRRISSPSTASRRSRRSRTTGSASRAASPSRWSCAGARPTTSRSPGTTPSR